MDYCNCCPGGCLLVDVAERLEDAMVRQTACYYQGQYEEEPLLLPLFQFHYYVRMLLCSRTASLTPDRTLGVYRVLEGVPHDLRERFWVAMRQRHHQAQRQFVSGQPAKNPHQRRGRRWLKVLDS